VSLDFSSFRGADILNRILGASRAIRWQMPRKLPSVGKAAFLALAFGAASIAQVGMKPKLPPPRMRAAPACNNCVRDIGGNISRNPAPVRQFRASHPCPSNGSLSGPCPGFVVDHVKALAKGGQDAPDNMRWRTVAAVTKERARQALR
jgi:hypothetical protein